MRKTKILATLGPATKDVATIKKMIKSGMDAARVNFSHGTNETRTELITMLKKARKELNKPIPIVLDTKGPEIRIKTFETERLYLEQGAPFTLTTRDVVGNSEMVSVTYKDLPKDLQVGSRVLIDDGLLELKVTALTKTDVKCVLVNSGFISARKGVNIPDVYVNLPSLTDEDIEDIKVGIKLGVDFIAASFVRTASDILNIRKVLQDNGGGHIHIIAKIESRDGVNNIDSILEVTDSIMVARGDLGVEIPPEEVPIVQKNLISSCNQVGKPVITATHMLESMVSNPRPTRAEANDVANAILDGSDVIMLSGETAYGQYPVESISMMARIAIEAERSHDYSSVQHSYLKRNITNAISVAAVTTAAELDAACIVPITDSGFASRMISRCRPACPILAITAEECVCRQLNLSWGCIPVLSEPFIGDSEVFDIAEDIAMRENLAKKGETIVSVAGVPVGIAGTTNTMKVRTVGNVLAEGEGNKRGIVKGITRVFKSQDIPEQSYFEQGDILICTQTNDCMIEYIKKAGAIVIGSWEQVDLSHAETVAKALDIPLLAVNVRVVDFVMPGLPVTVDTDCGLLINGYR